MIPLVLVYYMYDNVVKYIIGRFKIVANLFEFVPIGDIFGILIPVSAAVGIGLGLVGSIQTRNYDDANGAKQWVTEVVVSQAKFTGEAKKDSNSSGMPPVSAAVPPPEEIKQFVEGETKPTDEDYPF